MRASRRSNGPVDSRDENERQSEAVAASTRRQLVALCGGAALTGLAGCAGDDAGGDSSGDEPAGGDAGSGESSGTDGNDTGGSADGSNGGSGGDTFGDVVQFESAFVMEGYFEQEDGTRNEMVGRIDGSDSHWTFETDGETSEIIAVDGDNYVVSGDSCILNSGAGPDQGFTADQFEADRSTAADVTPSGTDTIDGENVHVYEVTSDEDDVTYYVSTETGYPVRVETVNGAFTFSSWGDVEPIEAPDMECRDPSQQN